jgi:hypothetical protein
MKKLLLSLIIFCGILFFYYENACSQVVVKVKPAKPKVVVVKPAKPGPRHIWVKGHWRWNKKREEYVWVKGHWVKPKKGRAWVPGHWKKVPGGFRWVPGHWRR